MFSKLFKSFKAKESTITPDNKGLPLDEGALQIKPSLSASQKKIVDELIEVLSYAPGELKERQFDMKKLPARSISFLDDNGLNSIAEFEKAIEEDSISWKGMGTKSIKAFLDQINNPSDVGHQEALPISQYDSWLKPFIADNPLLGDKITGLGACDDASYLENRSKLDSCECKTIDDYRFSYLLKIVGQESAFSVLDISPQWLLNMSAEYLDVSVRLRNFMNEAKITTVSDFLMFDEKRILSFPNMGRRSLKDLAEALTKSFKKGPPPEPGDTPQEGETLLESFQQSLNKLTAKNRLILEKRLGINSAPETLEEIAKTLDVTRERVRQIQRKLTDNLIQSEYWDDHLKYACQGLLNRDEPLSIEDLVQAEPWFRGFEGNLTLLKNILSSFSHLDIFFIQSNDKTYASRINQDVWNNLKEKILENLEATITVHYTTEDIEMIVENELEQAGVKQFSNLMVDELYQSLNFSLFDTEMVLVSIGNSVTSCLQTVLAESPTPIHYSKVAELYNQKFGKTADDRSVHARLSNGNFILFGRGTYGLEKHIIVSDEIRNDTLHRALEFLEENQNKQCHANEILQKAQIDSSVDKYLLCGLLAKEPKVTDLGKMVWVYGDTYDQRMHLKEVVEEVLRSNGKPMHITELEKKVSKTRSVGNHFAMNLQPNEVFSRIDAATWGLVERDFIMPRKAWEPHLNSFYEFLKSESKAVHQSGLRQFILSAGVSSEVTAGHLTGMLAIDSRFKRWRGGLVGLSEWEGPRRSSLEDLINKTISEAGDEVLLDDIYQAVLSETGYSFNKNNISIALNKAGYSYERDKSRWKL